ncbi:response regulator [Hylemonella gracilis]|uniref:DNA-binding transcriptional regulator BaeR n=1 Tax=Hylemonella gracilis ATCC 19624 TaxID=887062 RepID=F3KV55_9BURK|nr:response regulator [Hylemonella gracilis]EGI76330.1 DNA-binding transcriptional regulator BaeR [Hylemonella gracilis ATCC 19624]
MNAPPRILIVEDEPKLAQVLMVYLRAEGFATTHVDNGLAVEAAVRAHAPDVILLDLMLPGLDGISVCRQLRAFCHAPLIMLTARVDELDRLLGLEVGADDYLCKPYNPREVVARVKAQLRRAAWGPPASAQPGTLQLDDATLRASYAGQALDLTPAEFRLLSSLAAQAGRILSRAQLLDHLHDDGRAITDRAIDSHVRNLRRKLDAAAPGRDPIRSVYGVGYAWEEPPPGTDERP